MSTKFVNDSLKSTNLGKDSERNKIISKLTLTARHAMFFQVGVFMCSSRDTNRKKVIKQNFLTHTYGSSCIWAQVAFPALALIVAAATV